VKQSGRNATALVAFFVTIGSIVKSYLCGNLARLPAIALPATDSSYARKKLGKT
jgi:hypothetical protein